VYDGQGSTLVRVDKGDGLAYLVSSAAHRGETKQYTTFPYAVFERAILRYLGELKPEDILPASTARNALRDDLDAVEGRLGGLAKRIEKAAKELDEGGDIAAGFSLLRKWEGEQKMLETERENLRRELTSAEAIRLGDSQKTLDLLGKAREDDLYRLRQRAKQQIRNLVKAMVVRIEIEDGSRVITAKILLSTGVERGIKVRHGRHETTYSVLEDLQNLRTGGRPSRVRFRRDRHQQRIDRDSPSPGRDS
jgi:transcriptional regulator